MIEGCNLHESLALHTLPVGKSSYQMLGFPQWRESMRAQSAQANRASYYPSPIDDGLRASNQAHLALSGTFLRLFGKLV